MTVERVFYETTKPSPRRWFALPDDSRADYLRNHQSHHQSHFQKPIRHPKLSFRLIKITHTKNPLKTTEPFLYETTRYWEPLPPFLMTVERVFYETSRASPKPPPKTPPKLHQNHLRWEPTFALPKYTTRATTRASPVRLRLISIGRIGYGHLKSYFITDIKQGIGYGHQTRH